MGYYKIALKGLGWVGALRGLTRIIAFIKIAILARLLNPLDFGLFGISALVLALLEVFTETGINVFLIQTKLETDEYINTAWVFSLFRGFIISVLIFIFSPLISKFFNSPNSLPLLYLISIVPLIRGFINPSVVKFQKELNFRKDFLIKFSVFFIDAFFAVVFALFTKSPISLVLGLIIGAVFEVILSFKLVKPIPSFSLDSSKIKKIMEKGKWATLYGIFDYLFKQGDDIVVGKLLNTSALGLYQLAYKISYLPISEIGDVLIRVTFPVYVKISEDTNRLKKAFIKSFLFIALAVIPFSLIIFLFPKEIIIFLLGSKWLEAVGALRILAIFGLLRALFSPSYAVFLAVQKQKYVMISTLASVLVLGATIIPLVSKYGIKGAALSALIGTIINIPFILLNTIKVFKKNNGF